MIQREGLNKGPYMKIIVFGVGRAALRQGKFRTQLTRKTLPGPTKILFRSQATKLIGIF
jgi:hypothetical protein